MARADRAGPLDPVAAKGPEFDLVVLVDPEAFGEGIEGAVDRYVATTRATRQLVVLRSGVVEAAVFTGPAVADPDPPARANR